MAGERRFRGGHDGRERPFDWLSLAKRYGLPERRARELFEEAVSRASAYREPRLHEEAFYLELLEAARRSAWRPAPGKVTRTMRLEAERAGQKRRRSHLSTLTDQPIAPGKVTLTSYLTPRARPEPTSEEAQQPAAPVPFLSEMEAAFGEDFSALRISLGSAEVPAGATAATAGEHVRFRSTTPDRRLVAHELAHVVQHRRHPAGSRRAGVSRATDAAEREAEHAARAIVGGARAHIHEAPSAAVHLDRPDEASSGARQRAEIIEQSFAAFPQDEERALDQIRGQSRTMIGQIRGVYQRRTGRNLERDFQAHCSESQAREALTLLWPVMPLLDRLQANVEDGWLWDSENETGMLDVLRNASPEELCAAHDHPDVMKLLQRSLDADELLEARRLLAQDEDGALAAARERIEAARGLLDDDESAVWDTLLELTREQRLRLYNEHRAIFDFIENDVTSGDEGRRSLQIICTGTQAEALRERMRLATAGVATDDEGVAHVARRTGESAAREQEIAGILRTGQEQGRPITPERRAQLQAERAQLGGIREHLLTPERDILGRIEENSFLGMAADDVSAEELRRYAAEMGVSAEEVAKQQIVDAIGAFSDDEVQIQQAFERLDPAQRRAVREDPMIWAKLAVYLDEDERAVVDIYAGADQDAIAIENVRRAYDRVDTDEVGVIRQISMLTPAQRARLARDPLWDELRSSWAFSAEEQGLLDTLMRTGTLPTEASLDYALGRPATFIDPHSGQETTGRIGGDGGMEMLETWMAGLTPEQRASHRMGYWLVRSGREPSSPSLVEQRDAFLALERRMSLALGGDELQAALDQLLGPPTPDDLQTPAGRRLAAEILLARMRDKQALQGSLADGFTETDETADMASVQLAAAYEMLVRDGEVSQDELFLLGRMSRQYDERYADYVSSVDAVANVAGMVGAIAAGIVVTILSGATAGPLVAAALAKWGVVGAVAGAVTRVGVSELVGGEHYDATGAEGARDALGGAVDGAMAVISAGLALRFTSMIGLSHDALAARMAGATVQSARAALQHVGRRAAGGMAEGAIDGFLSGAVGELVLAAADKGTWDQGVWDALCDIGAAALDGGATGLGTGLVVGGLAETGAGALQARRGSRVVRELAEHLPGRLDELNLAQLDALAAARAAFASGNAAAKARALKELAAFLSPAELERVSGVFASTARKPALLATLRGYVRRLGLRARDSEIDMEVLEVEEFAQRFGSEQGRAVLILEGGRPSLHVRADIEPDELLDEASHLAQLQDPDMAAHMRLLDEANLDDWGSAPAQHRLELYQRKLDVEIDAKRRSLEMLESDPGVSREQIEEVTRNLTQLEQRQAELAAITPDQLTAMNAGALPLPQYLDEPPRLFNKRSREVIGRTEHGTAIDDAIKARVDDSSACSNAGVRQVRRVGDAWIERTLITSGYDGAVQRVQHRPDGSIVITIRARSGNEHHYSVEAGGVVDVEPGKTVSRGDTLAKESSRQYRLVEIEYDGDRPRVMREEILEADGTQWRQRGSESTRRGEIMEKAAHRQIDTELTTKQQQGRISGHVRLPHQRGGGGFDDVIVEFQGTGDDITARIRIIEVKDYPNRTVPLEDFTAIRGEGLAKNLQVLRDNVLSAVDGTAPRGFEGLTDAQLDAILTALDPGSGQVRIELMLGPTTRLGAEGHHAATVIPSLRRDIERNLGYDALIAPSGDSRGRVAQENVDAVIGSVQ